MVSLSVASVCENVRLFRWVTLFELLKVHQIQNVNWNYILQNADFKWRSFEHHMIKSYDALNVWLLFFGKFEKSSNAVTKNNLLTSERRTHNAL